MTGDGPISCHWRSASRGHSLLLNRCNYQQCTRRRWLQPNLFRRVSVTVTRPERTAPPSPWAGGYAGVSPWGPMVKSTHMARHRAVVRGVALGVAVRIYAFPLAALFAAPRVQQARVAHLPSFFVVGMVAPTRPWPSPRPPQSWTPSSVARVVQFVAGRHVVAHDGTDAVAADHQIATRAPTVSEDDGGLTVSSPTPNLGPILTVHS